MLFFLLFLFVCFFLFSFFFVYTRGRNSETESTHADFKDIESKCARENGRDSSFDLCICYG